MSEVISWLLDSAERHCETDGPDSIRGRHLREAAQEISALKAQCEAHERLLRDIGQYCEDNLHNTAMLTSMPPKSMVAWHVHHTVLQYLRALADEGSHDA